MLQWHQSHLKTPVPVKRRKTEEESTIAAQLSMCIKDNQELHKKLDAFDPSKIAEVVTQAVAGGYQKSFQKPNTYQKPTNPFIPSQQKPQASQNTNLFGKPYLGPPREPQVTPSADGSLNPALRCKYCKDTGHNISNCAKVKRKEALKAAAASQQPNIAKKGKLDRPGSRDRDPGLLKIYDPKQFLGKHVYNESELDVLRTTVKCKTLTEAERYNITEQAVAPCPEITMIIKGQKVQALLDMGSQVTFMNESYFLQNIQQLLPTVDKDHLNAFKLFNLKGVEDGCVPLTKYFSVDIQVDGRLVHDIGILVKKDNIPLTDSKGRSTWAPAILGCNLIWKGMEEFIRDHGEMCLKLFECPAGVDPLYFSTLCVYFYAECQKVIDQAKEKVKRDVSINSMGVGNGQQGSRPSENTNESTQPTQPNQSNQPKPNTTGYSKKNPKSKSQYLGEYTEKVMVGSRHQPICIPAGSCNFLVGTAKGVPHKGNFMMEGTQDGNLPSGVAVNNTYVQPTKLGCITVCLQNTNDHNVWIRQPLYAGDLWDVDKEDWEYEPVLVKDAGTNNITVKFQQVPPEHLRKKSSPKL